MLTLTYPKRQSIAFSNVMLRLYNLARHNIDNEVRFDLSRSESLTPFGIIILTSTLHECFRKGKKCFYIAPNNQSLKTFLEQIGFNAYFHLKYNGTVPDRL